MTLALCSVSVAPAHAGARAANEAFPALATMAEPATEPAAKPPATPAPPPIDATGADMAGKTASKAARKHTKSRLAAATRHDDKGNAGRPNDVAVETKPAASAPGKDEARVGPAEPAKVSARDAEHPPAKAAEADKPSDPVAKPVEKAAEGPPAHAVADEQHEKAAPTLAELVARHARENGVPLELAQAVVRIESRGNAHAANHGALGLMQIKPGTARSVGFNGGAAGLFSPDVNLRYGMKVLGAAFRAAGGDTCRALAQYQSGSRVTHMSASNRAYCSRARAVMAGA